MGATQYRQANIMIAEVTLAPAEFCVMNTTPWLMAPAPGPNFYINVLGAAGYLNVTTSTLTAAASISLVSYGTIVPSIANPYQGYGPPIFYNDTFFSFSASPTDNPPQYIQTLQNFIPSPNLTNDYNNASSPFFQNNAIYLTSTANNMYPIDNQTHLMVWMYYQVLRYIPTDFNDN